jgi:hypothetical protein
MSCFLLRHLPVQSQSPCVSMLSAVSGSGENPFTPVYRCIGWLPFRVEEATSNPVLYLDLEECLQTEVVSRRVPQNIVQALACETSCLSGVADLSHLVTEALEDWQLFLGNHQFCPLRRRRTSDT